MENQAPNTEKVVEDQKTDPNELMRPNKRKASMNVDEIYKSKRMKMEDDGFIGSDEEDKMILKYNFKMRKVDEFNESILELKENELLMKVLINVIFRQPGDEAFIKYKNACFKLKFYHSEDVKNEGAINMEEEEKKYNILKK